MNNDQSDSSNTTGVHAWLVLWKTYHAVQAHAVRSIESLSICPSDFGVLEVLLHKGPMPINTIGKKVLLTSGSITALVDRLEKRGLVERFDDAADRRIRLVRLTDEGRKLIEAAFASHETHLDEAVSDLSFDELAKLIELLKKLGRGAEARLT
ncbi:MAG: MarR family transcriptional regulator [Cyanobacteria bacterium SZAS LIN-2]|nr:MarR family transcriptional regulator [Cyanobacteria bacterium SZAS LIN-2]MBS2009701.1 MarR family transcriptional regulator [Cyanobacteria bacterium SZAS TMP-1]